MLPIEVVKMDHVAMATWDATENARLLTDVLGARFVDGGDQTDAGFRWLQFAFPNGKIEVVEPLSTEGFLYRFLTQRGPGLHHVTLYVRDLEASIPALTDAGYTPVEVDLSHDDWKEAFLHPRDTSGVLVQLAQTPYQSDRPSPSRPLEDFLADRPSIMRP